MEGEWGGARGLLLLDGCDWLMDSCSELLADWVSRTLQTRASVMLTATRDVAGICGVTQESIQLGPLSGTASSKLLLALAPRAVAHSELFGPEPAAKLMTVLAELSPDTQFELHQGRRVTATRLEEKAAAAQVLQALKGSLLEVRCE